MELVGCGGQKSELVPGSRGQRQAEWSLLGAGNKRVSQYPRRLATDGYSGKIFLSVDLSGEKS